MLQTLALPDACSLLAALSTVQIQQLVPVAALARLARWVARHAPQHRYLDHCLA